VQSNSQEESTMRMTPERVLSTIPIVTEVDAHRIADQYVTTAIDPTFAVVNGTRYYHKSLGREIWQFILRSDQAPLDAIYVDAQMAAVIR
jgi:hypothetical protein